MAQEEELEDSERDTMAILGNMCLQIAVSYVEAVSALCTTGSAEAPVPVRCTYKGHIHHHLVHNGAPLLQVEGAEEGLHGAHPRISSARAGPGWGSEVDQLLVGRQTGSEAPRWWATSGTSHPQSSTRVDGTLAHPCAAPKKRYRCRSRLHTP